MDQRIQDYQRQLRRLASELSLAEARERREIASDLHDHIGQALAFVHRKVTELHGNSIFSGMEKDITEILLILDQTIRYTRDLTVEISPPILYELGLAPALDWLAERSQKRYKLKVAASESGTPEEISEDIKVFVFKSVQELIYNVAKHAKAQKVIIKIDWQKDQLHIDVSDDGCGFDAEALDKQLICKNCFGLFSIRERLSYIGGRFDIKSEPGQGTRVTIESPYRIIGEVEDD